MRFVDQPIYRRRRRTLGAAALAAVLVGAAIGSTGGGAETRKPNTVAATATQQAPKRKTAPKSERKTVAAVTTSTSRRPSNSDIARTVGSLLILRFDGATAPGYVLDALKRHRAAGVILFDDNMPSAGSVKALTAALRKAGGPGTIICTDQEGGSVRQVRFAPPIASQSDQANSATVAGAASAGAKALKQLGINVALGPVADVRHPNANIGGRSYGTDPSAVARDTAAAVKAWRAGGVQPTVKHFPGFGAATQNTDAEPTDITLSNTALTADLAPFRAGIDAGAPIVMLSHARYPALDANHIATQSPAILTLLRERLGFTGVAMTDSMEAKAVTARSSVPVAAQRSIAAGIDAILMTGKGSYIDVNRAVFQRARTDGGFRAKVYASAKRMKALRDTLAKHG